MPELAWNVEQWDDGRFDWSKSGEEWSQAWGGSEAQWYGALYPRLHRFLPAKRILEIAPGHGRWTKFLVGQCTELVGVDISNACVDFCNSTFKEHSTFIRNDGFSLDQVPGKFDFIFSFDSLVHAEMDVVEAYVPQLLELLTDSGVAFIHHSNYEASGASDNIHNRAPSVSAHGFARCVLDAGGAMLRQEIINWGDSKELIDCMSLFVRSTNSRWPGPRLNPRFWEEAKSIRANIAPYFAARV